MIRRFIYLHTKVRWRYDTMKQVQISNKFSYRVSKLVFFSGKLFGQFVKSKQTLWFDVKNPTLGIWLGIFLVKILWSLSQIKTNLAICGKKLLESCLVSYSKVAWPPCMYCKMAYLESLSPPPLWWWIFADAATLIWDVNVDLRQTRNRTWNHRCYYDPFLHLQMNCYSGRVGRIADGLIFGCGEVGTAWFPHWLMMKSHRNDPFCYCYWKIVRKQGEKVF